MANNMANTNNIDTDILNYNYDELLSIFKLTNMKTIDSAKLERKLLNIKERFTEEIYYFYFKAYKILLCIFQMNLEDNEQADFFINKIKKVRSFEAFGTNELITLINVYGHDKGNERAKEREKERTHDLEQVNYGRSVLNIGNEGGPISNRYTYPVAPGNLNSIKRVTHIQNLNMNSCFRANYKVTSSTDFQYIIPTEIKNVISIRLASIEIPNAWYFISQFKQNNTFTIIILSDFYLITIPDGNYTADSITTYLNTTYFYQSTNTTDLQYIKFLIDPNSQKSCFQLITTAPIGLLFTLLFAEENENKEKDKYHCNGTLGLILGFRLPEYYHIDSIIYSEGVFNSGNDRYLYVSLNDYQYNNNVLNIVGFEKSILDDYIIAKIPIINGCISFDINNPLTKTRRYNGPVNIRNFHIKLLDMFGQSVDLNYMDYSFTLEMEILYECFNFKDVLA